MNTVWIVSSGDGCDGDEWKLEGIYSTREKADEACKGTRCNEPEEWSVDPEK
jgi:hypothetical protein